MKRDPILLMYNALMAIGFLAQDSPIRSAEWRMEKIDSIANAALREMNVDHTKAVQKVFGMRK
jgi:hypothetical protein